MRGLTQRIASILGSRQFYWFTLGFFVFQALWIALSAVYPMAFDEDFHLSVIRIYSEQWSPFLATQPNGTNQFGALAADPSYLYHYLMSFPYRMLSIFTDSQAAQVIFLRLINIGIITAGVVLFRRLLLRVGTSPALANTGVLLFALIPSVALLAGQINYDNLVLLALAVVCWLTLDITQKLQARKIDLTSFTLLAIVLMLACLIKYAFLPFAIVAVGYVTFMVWRTFRNHPFRSGLTNAYKDLSRQTAVGLLILLALSAGLFLQRYGVNTVNYGHPVPDCSAVIGIEACMEYGPWGRNYRYAASKSADFSANPLAYTWTWLQSMHYRMFFMITGPPTHTNYPPALFPSAAAVAILVYGATALVFYWRRIFVGRPFLVFILLMTLVYGAILWSQNYEQYAQTGQPVAINGRYFLPLMLPMIAVFSIALGEAFRSRRLKTWVAVAVIALFLQGGGVFSFILRSDPSWYWPNPIVLNTNTAAQQVLSRVMFIGPKNY